MVVKEGFQTPHEQQCEPGSGRAKLVRTSVSLTLPGTWSLLEYMPLAIRHFDTCDTLWRNLNIKTQNQETLACDPALGEFEVRECRIRGRNSSHYHSGGVGCPEILFDSGSKKLHGFASSLIWRT